jgi:serine/threonine protein kinase
MPPQVELEARLHIRALHPHIVRCHALLEDVTHKYLVIEYGEQGDLRQKLHGFTEQQLRDRVVLPLLQALRHIHAQVRTSPRTAPRPARAPPSRCGDTAHTPPPTPAPPSIAQGIVHRDLKPENVFVVGPSVKLGDFGLAVSLDDTGDAADTQKNSLKRASPRGSYCSAGGGAGYCSAGGTRYTAGGTPLYTSPEVLTAVFQNQSIDATLSPKNDIWALALMVLEAVSKEHPFNSACRGGYGHLLLSIANHDAISIPPTVCPELREWLQLALRKDPAQRAGAEQLLQHPWMKRDYGARRAGCWPAACWLMAAVPAGCWRLRMPHLKPGAWPAAAALAVLRTSPAAPRPPCPAAASATTSPRTPCKPYEPVASFTLVSSCCWED